MEKAKRLSRTNGSGKPFYFAALGKRKRLWYTETMNEKEQAALEKLLSSKNYKEVCPDAVRRIFTQALSRYRTVKEADKAARSELHQLTGAFMSARQLQSARDCLEKGDLSGALSLHASTKERPGWRETYEYLFSLTGKPSMVLDLACGLNPLCLGSMGVAVTGMDVNDGAVSLINQWAEKMQWPVSALCRDLLGPVELPRAHVALMMKLLPVLERQKTGAGVHLLTCAPARWKLVTFPTRTLGGRRVGMESQYESWMMEHIPPGHRLASRFVRDDELCFLLEDKYG